MCIHLVRFLRTPALSVLSALVRIPCTWCTCALLQAWDAGTLRALDVHARPLRA